MPCPRVRGGTRLRAPDRAGPRQDDPRRLSPAGVARARRELVRSALPKMVRTAWTTSTNNLTTLPTAQWGVAMSGLSRRSFLSRGSLTVVAAGVAGSMPAITAAATGAAPEVQATLDDGTALDGPLVAQVT